MKTKYSGIPIIAILLLWMFWISACQRNLDENSARQLQKTITAPIEDSNACPTGDSEDLQGLIDEVASNGIVRLPQGCLRITTTITVPTGIQLVGAGVGQTILYRDPGGYYFQPMLKILGSADSPGKTEISGISFIGVRDTSDTGEDYGVMISDVAGFRVDHCYFEGFGWAGVFVEGASDGVIDHSIFIGNFKQGIDNLGYGVGVYGTGAWNPDLHPGGDQATFIEDNLFIGNRHSVAASAGAHYVFRYNQVLRNVLACAVDAHGMGYGNAHGTQYVEIYNNTIESPADKWCGIGIRGGSGVIFDNIIHGYKNPILLILEWGTPDNFKAKYPAFEQIQDLYIWNNKIQGGTPDPQVDETGVGFIELNRDYFPVPMPGYISYTYPHPFVGDSLFDEEPWPPINK